MKAENADLRDRLDAQGQHPGFPRLQPTQEMVEDWLPFVENVYEIIDRSIERMLTLDLDDPDEPVAGTASGPGQEQLTRYIGHWILPVDDEPVAGTA